MLFGDDTDDNGTLFDGFLSIFHLKDAALWRATWGQRVSFNAGTVAYKVILSLS